MRRPERQSHADCDSLAFSYRDCVGLSHGNRYRHRDRESYTYRDARPYGYTGTNGNSDSYGLRHS